MIKTESIVVDGLQLRRTWSDAGFMIERDGAVYSEAMTRLNLIWYTRRRTFPWNLKVRTRSLVPVAEL